jgi:hypothetical protein
MCIAIKNTCMLSFSTWCFQDKTGRKHSDEHCAKKTSKKRSAEIRAQISMAVTGKKHSGELFSKNQQGEDCSNNCSRIRINK